MKKSIIVLILRRSLRVHPNFRLCRKVGEVAQKVMKIGKQMNRLIPMLVKVLSVTRRIVRIRYRSCPIFLKMEKTNTLFFLRTFKLKQRMYHSAKHS